MCRVSEESPVGASAVSAVKSVREMQSTARTSVAHIELVYSITSDFGSAISTWTLGECGTCMWSADLCQVVWM